ncbi:protein FD [Vitis riparia]|uniref:protein FD n=1 Tax=Vitis riparia TaxID=96939 RepID=UPI00155A275C|nr:protein FD [Vitis riparia]
MLSSTGGEEANLSSGNNNNNRVSSSSSKSSSTSSSPSPFSPASSVLPTPRGKNMEEVWKDINLASLHDHPSREDLSVLTRPQNPHANFRGVILQDFLARPFNKEPPTSVASLDQSTVTEARIYGSLPPPPATVLSLNSGPEFHFLESSHPARPHSHLVQHNPISNVASFSAPFDALASSTGLTSFGKKRFSESDNNSCDRRHKRMIKNRESAARSRARKQAYTNELELEVAHLMEENARLKRQQEQLTSATAAQLPKKNTLHRTSTAPF